MPGITRRISCLTPSGSPLKGDIPNKYPLYKVYMGSIIKGTHPKGLPTTFPMINEGPLAKIQRPASWTRVEPKQKLGVCCGFFWGSNGLKGLGN